MMNSLGYLKIFAIVAMASVALSACRAEEQGRVTRYKPGVYLGQKDANLSEAQLDALKQRIVDQGDGNYRASGGGGGVVKPPVDTGTLGTRMQLQGGGKQP